MPSQDENAGGPLAARHAIEASDGAWAPSPAVRYLSAGLVASGLGLAIVVIGRDPQAASLQLSLIFGAIFGFVLQRSRFCFFCIWRDWQDRRDPAGLFGILAALAVGIAGYTLVFGAWLPDPSGTRLPPTAHIGPLGPVVLLGGLAFGAGMAISGSCISAHFYRLGEGSVTSPFALVGAALGFGLGFLTWNPLYLWAVSDSPVVWLPRHLGYGGALALSLAVLAGLTLLLLRNRVRAEPPSAPATPLEAVFVRQWPAWLGGLAVGAIGVAAYLRIAPLGVTAELGARSRQGADVLGWLPARLEGLDTLRGCATLVRDAALTPNGLFVIGLVATALVAGLLADAFRVRRPTLPQLARGVVGGVLLGFGAMIGLGCTVGTLLSGIMAGAASGWAFAVAMIVGTSLTLVGGRAIGLLPRLSAA
jgi:hypothetical protein